MNLLHVLDFINASIKRMPLDISLHGMCKKHKTKQLIDCLLFIPAIFHDIWLFARQSRDANRHGIHMGIVAIIKNEGPYLVEWLEYHRILGFDRFYLYDNDSDDNTHLILKPYIDEGIVIYTPLPGITRQYDAYNHVLNHYAHACKFLAIIDLDEFIYTTEPSLRGFLEDALSNPHAGGLAANWMVFGSSHRTAKSDDPVTQTYFMRSTEAFDKNLHVKTIVIPQRVLGFTNPHYPVYMPGYTSVTETGSAQYGAFSPTYQGSRIRINHYFTKSYEEFLSKRNRGMADSVSLRDIDTFTTHDRNELFDDSMAQYGDRLRRAMDAARPKDYRT